MHDPKQLQSHYAVINDPSASQAVSGRLKEEEHRLEMIRVSQFLLRIEGQTAEDRLKHRDGENYLVAVTGSAAQQVWPSRR